MEHCRASGRLRGARPWPWLLVLGALSCRPPGEERHRDQAGRPAPGDALAHAAAEHVSDAASSSAAAAPVPEPPAPRTCAEDAWLTYAHDNRRTSASPGCCDGALRELWRFRPPVVLKVRPPTIDHAIADASHVFTVGTKGKSTSAQRLDTDGNMLWTFDSRADLYQAHWPTFAHGHLLVNDDGLYLLNGETGKNTFSRGLDTFGENLADAARFYLVNTWHVEGPGLFVGAFTRDGLPIWKRNTYGSIPLDMMDDLGGLALDGGVLFQASNYKFAPFSGVFAFDAESGAPRWSQDTKPLGFPSIGHGHLYLVERSAQTRERALVARSVADGAVQWSLPVRGARGAAPVVAGKLVLVDSDKDGILAVDGESGEKAWAAPIEGKRRSTVGCATTMAAALGSDSLIVTSDDRVRLLSLADGHELWSGVIAEKSEIHSPVLIGTRLYVVASGDVVALSCEVR